MVVNSIIAIGTDHAGYNHKEKVVSFLQEIGYKVIDCGCFSDQQCDYPDYGSSVAKLVSQNKCFRGILICNSGIGMSIIANKFYGIRAAICYNIETAKLASSHNNANILCLPAGFVSAEEMCTLIKVWLETPFAGDRHLRRLNKIVRIEKKYIRKI